MQVMLSQDSRLAMSPHSHSNATIQLSLETCAVEMTYSQSCGKYESICEAEKARQLRLQILLLENENNELYSELAQSDERIEELEYYAEHERDKWEFATEQLDAAQKSLRLRSREVETLKAETTSLCGVKMDSTKVLTEKTNLARELSNLKPELEHLRSQNSTFQSHLSEKLSLQRQLSTLQVEIENERRSTKRLNSKESKAPAGEGHSEAQLEQVQAELAKEKKERLNTDRETQQSATTYQNKIAMYESRLDAFRGKLKSTKESLKEVQSELRNLQVNGVRPSTTTLPSTSRSRNNQKRAASEMDTDTMLGTPGDLGPAKSKKAKSTMLGEKSAFSMTPFLNRTANLDPEGPSLIGRRDSSRDVRDLHSPSPDEPLKIQSLTKSVASKGTMKDIAEAKDKSYTTAAALVVEKSKSLTSRRPTKKAIASPKLSQVAEEGETDLPAVPDAGISKPSIMENTFSKLNEGPEKKKVKRKMLGGSLGKTLFDEEEGDVLQGGRRIGAAKTFVKAKRGGRVDALGNVGAVNDFGPFSPLKKDRKAVAV